MTAVHLAKRFERDLTKIPSYLRDKTIFWIELVETLGLMEVRKRPGYHDEPLKGKRKGYRSVRLNRAYRIIYREDKGLKEIILVEVTKHEY